MPLSLLPMTLSYNPIHTDMSFIYKYPPFLRTYDTRRWTWSTVRESRKSAHLTELLQLPESSFASLGTWEGPSTIDHHSNETLAAIPIITWHLQSLFSRMFTFLSESLWFDQRSYQSKASFLFFSLFTFWAKRLNGIAWRLLHRSKVINVNWLR